MDATTQISLFEAPMLTEYIIRATNQLMTQIISTYNLDFIHERVFVTHYECNTNTVSVHYKIDLYLDLCCDPRDDLEKNLSQVFRKHLFSELNVVANNIVEYSISSTCPSWNKIDSVTICEGQTIYFESEDGLKNTIKRYADLVVNDMLWCPQVELNSTEYSVEENSGNIRIKATQRTLTQTEYQLTDKKTVKICLSDYQQVLSVAPPNISVTSSGLLSLICTSISLAFLVASIFMYAIVPNLRTDVSRYNMTLAFNLIAAQTLFEFGSELIHLPLTCQIIGILAHYFWLSSVFWMNACIINLFYKMCFPFHSRGHSDVKLLSLLSLYSFITPGVIVMITSLSNYLVLGFSGYGRGICYLSNARSRIYGLAVPVGILVCVNILLFLYTLITIYRLPNLKSTSTNKVSIIMCVNLSTITGVSWILGFAYEATGFVGFAYAFSVFLGSIGLFLFMTFFANKLKDNLSAKALSRCCSESVKVELPPSAGSMGKGSTSSDDAVHM